jgi:hypothetical protein
LKVILFLSFVFLPRFCTRPLLSFDFLDDDEFEALAVVVVSAPSTSMTAFG